jgi:serine phosphatase RsbU (regulator of sigma subunit)
MRQRINPAPFLFPAPVSFHLSQFVECPLAGSDTFVLYTDGVIESAEPAGEEFGEQRLTAAIGARLGLTTERIFDETLAEARRFSGADSFADDVCMVGVDVDLAMSGE